MEKESPYLGIEKVTKRFGKIVALDDVSLGIEKGEFISILGPSGCGKTTLLRVIAGLEEQDEGRIHLQSTDISREPTSKRNFGIVFQSYALFPNLTVAQNVAYGLKGKMTKAEIAARVEELLSLVGLPETGGKFPSQMSGGQQQRVALARALAPNPSMLLLDEPLSALDARVRTMLREEIRRLQLRLGITTVMVTHDQEEALTMADRIVVMKDGKLMQVDTPHGLYFKPNHPFVADFIGSMNLIKDWVLHEDKSLVRDNAKLVLDDNDSPNGNENANRFTLAIRPEHIKPADDLNGKNVLHAQVDSIEFRGAAYRMRLAIGEGKKRAAVEMDLDSRYQKRFNPQQGETFVVQFPAEHIILFPEQSDAGMQ